MSTGPCGAGGRVPLQLVANQPSSRGHPMGYSRLVEGYSAEYRTGYSIRYSGLAGGSACRSSRSNQPSEMYSPSERPEPAQPKPTCTHRAAPRRPLLLRPFSFGRRRGQNGVCSGARASAQRERTKTDTRMQPQNFRLTHEHRQACAYARTHRTRRHARAHAKALTHCSKRERVGTNRHAVQTTRERVPRMRRDAMRTA